jgi:outer membrane protein OmpA-like peptidoglycan-associated protein
MRLALCVVVALGLGACQTVPNVSVPSEVEESPALLKEAVTLPPGPAWTEVRAEFMTALLAANLEAREEPNGTLKLTLPFEGVFNTNSSAIRRTFQSSLDRIALILHTHPLTLVRIVGHTDNRGPAPVNQKLSEERAQAVMNHLIGRGVPFTRLRFEGKGASLPAADNRTEEGRAKNRRVEVFIEPQR